MKVPTSHSSIAYPPSGEALKRGADAPAQQAEDPKGEGTSEAAVPARTRVNESGRAVKAVLSSVGPEGKEVAVPGTDFGASELFTQLDEANEAIRHTGHALRLERHDELDRFVVKVVDQATGEIIRQFPPDDFLKTSERLSHLVGMLFANEG